MENQPSGVPLPLFHYTYERAARSIVDGGHILVERLPPHLKRLGAGRPAAWFSLNPVMEMTARKAVAGPIEPMRVLSIEEQAELFGLYRFVFESVPEGTVFLSWPNHRLYSGATPAFCDGLEDEGLRQGANPTDWYSSFQPVPVNSARLQVWEKGAWYDCSH